MLHSDVFMETVHEWAVRLKEMDWWGHDGQSCRVHTLNTNNHHKQRRSCCRLTSEYVLSFVQDNINHWMTHFETFITSRKKNILVKVLKNNSTTYIVFFSLCVCSFLNNATVLHRDTCSVYHSGESDRYATLNRMNKLSAGFYYRQTPLCVCVCVCVCPCVRVCVCFHDHITLCMSAFSRIFRQSHTHHIKTRDALNFREPELFGWKK